MKARRDLLIIALLTTGIIPDTLSGLDKMRPYPCPFSNSRVLPTALLKDPAFERGVQHGITTAGADWDHTCRKRWLRAMPSLNNAMWQFVEVAEKTYLCENPDTPRAGEGFSYIVRAKNGSKQFRVKDGIARYTFDSSREWRTGCQMNFAEKSGARPRFGDDKWNWPHFLLRQVLTDETDAAGKVRFEAYRDITFRANVTLRRLVRTGADCPEWNFSNHAVFYMGFVLERQTPSKTGPKNIYALVNGFYTRDGNTNIETGPWLGGDPADSAVYFSPGHPMLVPQTPTTYDIDVKRVAVESVAAYNRRQETSRTIDIRDYVLGQFLIGSEMWGDTARRWTLGGSISLATRSRNVVVQIEPAAS